MQGECNNCQKWSRELGRCAVCLEYVCLDCYRTTYGCCTACFAEDPDKEPL